VHTSATACPTIVAIWISIRDPYRHQNLIICSSAHCQPSVKISSKSFWTFLRKVANRQTATITYPRTWLSIYTQCCGLVLLLPLTCSPFMMARFLFPLCCVSVCAWYVITRMCYLLIYFSLRTNKSCGKSHNTSVKLAEANASL